MKSLVLGLILVYVFFCLMLFLFQRQFLYFPTPAYTPGIGEPISFELEAGIHRGWVTSPGQAKALLYYGGNAETVEANTEFFSRVLPETSVYLIPYRGYAGNPGAPSEQALYKDALAILDAIAPNHQTISLMGRSLGSGIATHVATRRNVEKVVLVTPYDSILAVAQRHYPIFPVRLLLKDEFPSLQNARQLHKPVLVVSANNDQVIPRQHTQNLVDALPETLVEWRLLESVGHNDLDLHPDYVASIKAFLGD